MPCLTYSGSDQAVHLGLVLALTSVWWACAVGVTVVLKVALGSEPDSPDSAWSFPFPLTLTLLGNVGTAVACGLLGSLASGHGLMDVRPRASVVGEDDSPQLRIEQPGPPLPPSQHTMLHSTSTEALRCSQNFEATVQESPGVPDIAAAAAQACARGDFVGCPVPSPIAACGCFSRRRKHGALTHTMPLELEILTEPELLALPFAEDDVAVRPPQFRPHLAQEHFSHMPGAAPGFAGPVGPRGHTEVGDPGAPSSGPADVGASADAQHEGTHSDAPKSEQHFALITMGLIQGLALGAKNEALLLLSVSTRTMIFSTNVLVVMLMARLFGLEQLKKTKLVAALLLTVGGILQGVATWFHMHDSDNHSDEPLGYALACLALVLDAMRWVLLQAVFAQEGSPHPPAADGGSSGGEPAQLKAPALSKLDMVSWVMWTTTPVCFGLSIFFEPRGLEHVSRHPVGVMGLVALLTLGVMGINIAEFGIVQWTSAVTFNVLSQLHSIPMVMAGVIFFGEQIAPVQVLGFAICLVGALLYSFVKAQEKRMPQTPFGSREHTTIIHGGRENSSAIRGIQMAITVHHPDGHFRQVGCR